MNWPLFASTFSLIFVAELPDKTVLALWTVTALAIVIGHNVKNVIHPKGLHYASAVAFAAVGIYFILTWFR